MNILILCGGSAVQKIIEVFKKEHDTTLLINAYDDGKSTGYIKRYFNILGPSDISKNIISNFSENISLYNLLDSRINSVEELVNIYEELEKCQLSRNKKKIIKQYIDNFIINIDDEYNITDHAIRNIIFIGCYLEQKDIKKTIDKLINDFDIPYKILLNNYDYTNLWAKTENGNILKDENAIITERLKEKINSVYLSDKYLDFTHHEILLDKYTEEHIKKCDILFFSATTLYSSLIPTLITKNMIPCLNNIKTRIFMINLYQERSFFTTSDIIKDIYKYLYPNQNPFDYKNILLLNNHGYTSYDNMIPVDKYTTSLYGTCIIDNFLLKDTMKHDCKKINNTIKELDIYDKLDFRKKINKLVDMPFHFRYYQNFINQINIDTGIKCIIPCCGINKRFGIDAIKSLVKISGKEILLHILEKLYHFDKKPTILVLENQKYYYQQFIEKYKLDVELVSQDKKLGSAGNVIKYLNECEDVFENIMVHWCDAPFTDVESIKQCIMVHKFLDKECTLATCFEKYPYAGIIRNEIGSVVDTFKQKNIEYGEHDSNFFVIKTDSFLNTADKDIITQEEIEMINVIKNMKITALFNTHPKHTKNINTREDYQNILSNEDNTINCNEQVLNNRDKYTNYTSKKYKAVCLDLDGTIYDNMQIDEDITRQLIFLNSKKIPITFITAGSYINTKNKLSPILDVVSNDNVYLFFENGGLFLDKNNELVKLTNIFPTEQLLELGCNIIKDYIRKYEFNIRVYNVKISINMKKCLNIVNLVNDINHIYENNHIPLKAYTGSIINDDSFITIVPIDVSKSRALEYFCNLTKIHNEDIIKIGDMPNKNEVDSCMLNNFGGFSVDTLHDNSLACDASKIFMCKNTSCCTKLLEAIQFDY